MQEFTITENDAGQRFDKYLFKLLRNAQPSLLYKQLRNKNITLNGKKAKGNEILQDQDCVKIFMAEETIQKFSGRENQNALAAQKAKTALPKFQLDVVYEDHDILAVNKPAGILSQKAAAQDISMNEYLLEYLGRDHSTFTPSFCNRLDRNTSGLLLAGKTLKGAQQISRMLKERSLRKYYLAIVLGTVKKPMRLDGYLIKDHDANQVTILKQPADHASHIITSYEPVDYNKELDLTLLKVHLITGKTHQIRAHLASDRHPILGDAKYGIPAVNRRLRADHQMLHAYEVIFPDDSLTIRTPFPKDFLKFFKNQATNEKEEEHG